tara:strand:- start:16 stop:276 length:261 start_codon:yes stop_codon:yes gene_type:complete
MLPLFVKETKMEIKKLRKYIRHLYCDYRRLSSSRQKAIDKIAKEFLGVPTNASDQELLDLGLPREYWESFRGYETSCPRGYKDEKQ